MANVQAWVRQYRSYLEGDSEGGDCEYLGRRSATGKLVRPSRLLGDAHRVGLAGLKAALQDTHYGNNFDGLHPVEIIEKFQEPFKVSNE